MMNAFWQADFNGELVDCKIFQYQLHSTSLAKLGKKTKWWFETTWLVQQGHIMDEDFLPRACSMPKVQDIVHIMPGTMQEGRLLFGSWLVVDSSLCES